jgi:hypothetical protein
MMTFYIRDSSTTPPQAFGQKRVDAFRVTCRSDGSTSCTIPEENLMRRMCIPPINLY